MCGGRGGVDGRAEDVNNGSRNVNGMNTSEHLSCKKMFNRASVNGEVFE